MARLGGIRFEGLSAAGGLGLVATSSGSLAMNGGTDVVRQSIMMLLSTIPGERVMRPDYGCPLHRLVFAPNDATTAGIAIHYVRTAINRFEPRAKILRLDAGAAPPSEDASGTRLWIDMTYRVRSTLATDSVSLSLDLTGDA